MLMSGVTMTCPADANRVAGHGLQGLKILFLFGNLELGGAERQGLFLARYLKDECKADVHVWGLDRKPGRLSELCEEHGIPWRGIDFHWGLRKRWFRFVPCVRELKRQRPDILISYTCVPNLVAALGWKHAGAGLCVWNQADEGLLLNRGLLHRFAVKRPHCYISNSSGGRDFLVGTYGLQAEKIAVVRNGIPAPAPLQGRSAWRDRLGVGDDAFVACMVANISPYKDHATLVRAWGEVVERIGSGCSPLLLLAGRFDGREDALRGLAAELGVSDSIRFLGKVADVDGLLSATDLFVYSSLSEGIPNAVLEAMTAGLPVSATAIPGIREAVGPDGTDFLAPPGDPTALARSMLRFLRDADLRREIGARLRRRAETEFAVDRMCRESAAIMLKALAARSV